MKKTPYRILISKSIPQLSKGLSDSMEDLGGGVIASYLTKEQYEDQLKKPYIPWRCPVTKAFGQFDDEWYETYLEEEEGG